MPEVILKGCTPEPLMNYLKALGVLRLIAEDRVNGDANARGFWRNDVFVLRSKFDERGIEDFFLNHYCPTPIVSPWNGAGGFLTETGASVDALAAIGRSTDPRLENIRTVTEAIRRVSLLTDFAACRDGKKTLDTRKKKGKKLSETDAATLKDLTSRVKSIKQEILVGLRSELPEQTLGWLDACVVIANDGFSAAPVLGSGGVDGRMEFGSNFLARVLDVLGNATSCEWLHQSLVADRGTPLMQSSIGQFAPGRIGGPNGTHGFEGDSKLNPWDFVLMLEGSLLLAGAAVRRFGADTRSRAVFPFAVRAIGVGDGSVADGEAATARGELWLPLWDRPSGALEIQSLFSEGRSEILGRPARNAVDFARAVTSLGVDRGIKTFARFGLLQRNGLAFLATPIGRLAVGEREHGDLLMEHAFDDWLNRFRRGCSGEGVPARFTSALRAIDSAILNFCQYGGVVQFQSILIALGAAERALATAERFRKEKFIRPLVGLSNAWIAAARAPDNGEFEVALALAGVDDPSHAIGSLRTNLESVALWRETRGTLNAKWAEKDRAVVWNTADLANNLAAVLDRRMMDGDRKGCAELPLASPFAASSASIAAFIHGELDDRKIEDLLWGLMLVDPRGQSVREQPRDLPSVYALLKLLFLPRTLVASQAADGGTKLRLANEGERGIRIRPEPAILALLRAGRVGEAAVIAMRRLRASGLNPLPHRRSGGPSRDNEWSELRLTPREGQRLAASLLIPIHPHAVNALVQQATRADTFDEPNETKTLITAHEGN